MKICKPGSLRTAALVLTLLVASGGISAESGPAVGWWVISDGGGPSSGGAVNLNTTLGRPVIGPASGGGALATIGLDAGYFGMALRLTAVTLRGLRAEPLSLIERLRGLLARRAGSLGEPLGMTTLRIGRGWEGGQTRTGKGIRGHLRSSAS